MHEYKLDVQSNFYYCENCPDEWTIQDLLRADIENQARIKALEGVVELQNSRKLAVDAIDFHKTEGCERCTSMFNDDTDTLYCEGLKRLEEKESGLFYALRNTFKKLEEV